MADAEGRAEEAKEKNTTAEIEALKTHEGMRQQGEVFTNSTILGMLDPSFTYSDMADRLPDLQKQHRERERATLEQTYGIDPAGRVKGKPYEKWDPTKAVQQANRERTSVAINKQFEHNGVPDVNIEMLQGQWQSRGELNELMRSGKIDGDDIPAIRATLQAVQKEMVDKAEKAETDKDQVAAEYYAKWTIDLTKAIETVRELNNDKTPIEGRDKLTIGMEAKRGNFFSGEWDPSEWDVELDELRNETATNVGKADRQKFELPWLAGPNSSKLSDADRADPLLMSILMDDFNMARKTAPHLYGEPDSTDTMDPLDPAGELGGY